MDGGAHPNELGAFASLAAELGDLKRLRDASSPDSFAARAFRRAWGRIVAGENPRDVAFSITADTLAAIRMGGIDAALLVDVGVANGKIVLERAFDELATPIGRNLRTDLRNRLGTVNTVGVVPEFVECLIRQPRAGATCPGKPRIVLEPAENHGDHCLAVAVLGVAISGNYGADPLTVFLAGLAHHLHNAVMPDSGFAGEVLLGNELLPLIDRLFTRILATLTASTRETVRLGLAVISDAETPEGRAFHAADVLDRVVQMRHFERVAKFTTAQALDDLNLVHAGPLQAFHQAVLHEAGLS